MQSALVVGGDGLIGRELGRALEKSGVHVVSTSRRNGAADIDLDLSLPFNTAQLPRVDVAYLCAGISRFAICEQDPVLARRVNVTAQLDLAKHFFLQGVHVVFLSSNAVFDGLDEAPAEDALMNPTSVYGKLKAGGERGLTTLAGQSSGSLSIVRLTKVLSINVPLIENWVSKIKTSQKFKAFSDQMLSPISLAYTVEGLRRCGDVKLNGVCHLSGEAELNYHAFAKALATSFGANVGLVCSENSNKPLIHNRLSMHYTEVALGMQAQNLESLLSDLKSQSFMML